MNASLIADRLIQKAVQRIEVEREAEQLAMVSQKARPEPSAACEGEIRGFSAGFPKVLAVLRLTS